MKAIETDLPNTDEAASAPEERYVTVQDVRALTGWSWQYAHLQQRRLFPPPHHVGGYGSRTYYWRWRDLEPIVTRILAERARRAGLGERRLEEVSVLHDPNYLSAAALARMAGVSRARMGQILASGRSGLPVKRHGRFILIPRKAAVKWLAQRQHGNGQEGSDEGTGGG